MSEEKKHILIIDDEEGIREPLKEYLESENFFVSTAKDAEDAKNKIQLLEFDLLIVDIMMPGQSGLELTKEIRKDKDTPIIFLTAMGESASRIHGLETGADDYVQKPFEPKALASRLYAAAASLLPALPILITPPPGIITRAISPIPVAATFSPLEKPFSKPSSLLSSFSCA